MVLPMSRFPLAFPDWRLLRHKMKVGIIAITISSTAPRNFPFTICHKLNGFFVKIQEFLAFLIGKLRMVTGIRKKNPWR
jgi:hypothetical protein